jgi:hypothetical protein
MLSHDSTPRMRLSPRGKMALAVLIATAWLALLLGSIVATALGWR